MSAHNLIEMVMRYWSTNDSSLLDQVVQMTSRLVPRALPPAIRDESDLLILVNRRLTAHWRSRQGPAVSSVEELRKLIGQTALNVLQDAVNQSRRWSLLSRYSMRGRLGRTARRRQTEWTLKTLDWIGQQLTDGAHIRVFDLMRKGLNSREISQAIGGDYSEQRVWIIKARIRALISEKIQDEFSRDR